MRARRGAVLVTGGAGFVGSHVVRRLAQSGPVIVLDDLSTGRIDNLPRGVQFVVGDVRSEADVNAALANDVEAVVHCAAQTSVARSMAEPGSDWSINVAGTREVARLAQRHGVKRFVFFSSGGAIYGDTALDAATESRLPQPESHYGLNKYVAEQIVRLETRSYAILRPSNIYGAGQRCDQEGGVVSIFLERLFGDGCVEVHGDGRQRRDFVYVDDVVDAVELALESRDDVVWNVCSGASTSVLELLQALVEVTGRDAAITRRPSRAGDVNASLLAPDRLLSTGRWGPPTDLTTGLRRLLADGAYVGDISIDATPVGPAA